MSIAADVKAQGKVFLHAGARVDRAAVGDRVGECVRSHAIVLSEIGERESLSQMGMSRRQRPRSARAEATNSRK